MTAAHAEYPQIRPMFADALKAMAEGETEAEKQIVYVLNEARAALPCPSFVATTSAHSFALHVPLGGKAVRVVLVSHLPDSGQVHAQWSGDYDAGDSSMEPSTLTLVDAVSRALRASHSTIMQAAMEAYPAAFAPPRKSPY